MKLEKGNKYYIEHYEIVPTRINHYNVIVESQTRNRCSEYEYIGKYGNKLHFYDLINGFDLFLSRKEFDEQYNPNIDK